MFKNSKKIRLLFLIVFTILTIKIKDNLKSTSKIINNQRKLQKNENNSYYSKVISLFFIIDKEFSKILQIFPLVKGTDIGLIGYYNGHCPEGWGDYLDGQHRYILGAGGNYSVGSKGGEFTHTLNEDEIPKHSHKMFANGPAEKIISGEEYALDGASYDGTNTKLGNENYEYQIQGTNTYPNLGRTGDYGNGKAHNIMPPYLTLRICVRLKDKRSNLTEIEKRYENFETKVAFLEKKIEDLEKIGVIDGNEITKIKEQELKIFKKNFDLQRKIIEKNLTQLHQSHFQYSSSIEKKLKQIENNDKNYTLHLINSIINEKISNFKEKIENTNSKFMVNSVFSYLTFGLIIISYFIFCSYVEYLKNN